MNNLSENKVILTDEQYKSVQSDLVMWHIDLVFKLTFVALVIFLLTYAKLFFSVGGGFGVANGVVLLALSLCAIRVITSTHKVQAERQNSLDRVFLGEVNDWRFLFLEIFPGKSIRLARREVRRYRRQKKLQKRT